MLRTLEDLSMALPLEAEPFPLRSSPDGTLRIGATRVPLETVVFAFNEGASAEEIAFRYPSLDLADIYAAVTYYLRHREAVDEYVRDQGARAQEVRSRIEARQQDRLGLRERLLSRRSA
jgi:uncharacterized protein (DUF433 family)